MKWQCTECKWIGVDDQLLVAPNPFNPDDRLVGCPNCFEVGQWKGLCEWDGCEIQSSSGTPMADGRYVWRCHNHRPISRDQDFAA
jgi:hypothetical protein